MRVRREIDGRHIQILYGSKRIRQACLAIERFQVSHPSDGTNLISIASFADEAVWNFGLPILAIVSNVDVDLSEPSRDVTDHILGVVLLRGHTILGIPTGFVETADLSGYGAVIGPASVHTEIVQLAAKAATSTLLSHTLRARFKTHHDRAGKSCILGWQHCKIIAMHQYRHDTLCLDENLDRMLAKFSAKTRKNLKYYRNKLESEHGCRFLATLDGAQTERAIDDLRASGKRIVEPGYAKRMGKLFGSENGGFYAGLCDRDGNWLSLIAGFRRGRDCYIAWQLNRELDGQSVSSAMRLHFLESEIARDVGTVTFVGGTWGVWERICEAGEFTDLLAFDGSLLGGAARRIMTRVQPDSRTAALYRQFLADGGRGSPSGDRCSSSPTA